MARRVNASRLHSIIPCLAGVRVGVVGDLVADLYVSGQTDRVSREAPVLIVRYEQEWLRPGGAANVAANLAALGAQVSVVGLLGDDDAGRKLRTALEGHSGPGRIDCTAIPAASSRATISKTRFLAGAKLTSRQQVLRLDREPAERPAVDLLDTLTERIAVVDGTVDAWIASDYGYGMFHDRLCDRLRRIARQKPVVADSRYELARFRGVSLIKPNEEEAETLARQLELPITEPARLVRALARKLRVPAALITLGNKGMVVADGDRVVSLSASGSDEIVDLTGAGDTVAATLTAALAAGADMVTAARLANVAGGLVVMKEGAATVAPDELAEAVRREGAGG